MVKRKGERYMSNDYLDALAEVYDILNMFPKSILNKIPKSFMEFIKNNIPVFSDVGTEYLETMEIQTMLNLLKVKSLNVISYIV